jgi:hypothetical protein
MESTRRAVIYRHSAKSTLRVKRKLRPATPGFSLSLFAIGCLQRTAQGSARHAAKRWLITRAAEPTSGWPSRHDGRGKSNARLSRHDRAECPSRSHRRAGMTARARHARQAAPKTALKSAKVPCRFRPQSAAPSQRILRRNGGGSRKSPR